jgi:hypothetical protein
MAHFGLRDPRQISELHENQLITLKRVLKGIQVIPTVGKPPKSGVMKPKSIKSIDSRGASAFMFDRNGVQMSVQVCIYLVLFRMAYKICVVRSNICKSSMEFGSSSPTRRASL